MSSNNPLSELSGDKPAGEAPAELFRFLYVSYLKVLRERHGPATVMQLMKEAADLVRLSEEDPVAKEAMALAVLFQLAEEEVRLVAGQVPEEPSDGFPALASNK